MIVFRLRRVGDVVEHVEDHLRTPAPPGVVEVPIENQHTERFLVTPSAEPVEAERREQQLVVAFKEHLESKGHRVFRHQCRPDGEAKPLFTDLFDATRGNLIEAKGSVNREAVRMAVGHLLDYRRFVTPAPRMALLAPQRPRRDLEEFLPSLDIACVWRSDGKFVDNVDGAFCRASIGRVFPPGN